MSNYDDALVPPGAARVPRRPGVTLVSVPAVPPPTPGQPSASPSAPSVGSPQSGGASQPSGPAVTHSVQPQAATTDMDIVVAPPGVNVPSRSGMTIVQPAAPPASPLNNVPQVTGPGVQGGGGRGGSRTDAAAPNDGILSAMLRADNGTSLSNPPLQPPSKGIGGNPVSNRSGAPAAIDNHISDGNIHFTLVGQPNKLGQVKVQVTVDWDAGTVSGGFDVQVGGKVVAGSMFSGPVTVAAFKGQKISVVTMQTTVRQEAQRDEDLAEPEPVIVVGRPEEDIPEAEEPPYIAFKMSGEPSVTSGQVKVVEKNGSVSLAGG